MISYNIRCFTCKLGEQQSLHAQHGDIMCISLTDVVMVEAALPKEERRMIVTVMESK